MQPFNSTRRLLLADPSSSDRRSSSTSQAYNSDPTRNPSSYAQAPIPLGYPTYAATLDNTPSYNNDLALLTTSPYDVASIRPSDTILTSVQPYASSPMTQLLQPSVLPSEFSHLSLSNLQPYSSYSSHSTPGLFHSPTTETGLSRLSLTTPPLYDGHATDVQPLPPLDDSAFDLYCQGLASSDIQSYTHDGPPIPYSAETFPLGGFATSSTSQPINASRANRSIHSNQLFPTGQSTRFSSEVTSSSLLPPSSLLNVNSFGLEPLPPINFSSISDLPTRQSPSANLGRPSSARLLPHPLLNVDNLGQGSLSPFDFPNTRNLSSVADSLPPLDSSGLQDSRRQRSTPSFSASLTRSRRYPSLPPPGTLETLISNSRNPTLQPNVGASAEDDIPSIHRLNRHICQVCGRAFSRPSTLATHMLSHVSSGSF